MRKLDKEHLKIILWIVIGITLLIYIPYGLAYTSLWFKPFQYTYVPPEVITQPTDNTYYAYMYPEIPHWNLMLMAWFEGVIKLSTCFLAVFVALSIGCISYLFYDWLFPKETPHKPYTPEKDGR